MTSRYCLMTMGLLCLAALSAPRVAAEAATYEPKWEGKGGLFSGGDMPGLAEVYMAGGKYKAAAKIYQRMYENAEHDENRASSLLAQANCLFLAHKDYAAQTAFTKLIDAYPSLIPIEKTLVTLRDLARRMSSGESSIFNFKNYGSAIEIYELILRVAPAGNNGPADMLQLAQLQAANDSPQEAIDTYHELIKRFPRVPESALARMEITRLLLRDARHGDGDGKRIRQASNEIKYFLKEYPQHPQAVDARTLLGLVRENQASRLYELGKFYLRKLSYREPAARRYLHDVVREYPDTAAAVKAAILLAKIEKTDVNMPVIPAGGLPGMEPDATGRVPGVATPVPPPEEPIRFLKKQEGVEKWLLPLEDLDPRKEGK